MDPKTRNAAIAAAAMLIVFGLVAYMMPAIMLWLRARSQRDKE